MTEQTTHSISEFGFKNNKPVNRASIVCLVNAAESILFHEIKTDTVFGSTVKEKIGDQLNNFLTNIKDMYEANHVTSTSSINYRASDEIWFSEIPLRRHIRGGNSYLNKASLVVIIDALIGQLRQRVLKLDRARIQGEFSSQLKDALETCLSKIAPMSEKSILVRERKEEQDDEEHEDGKTTKDVTHDDESDDSVEETSEPPKMRTIVVKYEPFVDQIACAFSEASKAQRIASNKARETRAQDRQKERTDG